ncbi:MAG: extracellular solute-binding protein [Clostridiales bacterium]|nr:extracellular solute-binding protein [Clostridiales bacterium]
MNQRKCNLRKAEICIAALLMLNTLLLSCGNESKTPDSDVTDSLVDTDNSVDTDGKNELKVIDLGGKDINVLIRSEWSYEFMVEEESGDLVSDAIFRRNQRVSEKYNCNFNFIDYPGNWANHEAFGNTIHNSVMAGDGAFDFIAGYEACIPIYVNNGDLLNLLDLPYLDLSADWWTQQGVDALTINGKCYMAGGDIATTMVEGIFCMYYNKRLAEENNIGDIYQMVRDHTWTHDNMLKMISDVARDLNGDGNMDENDQYGFMTREALVRNYMVAYDTPTLGYNDAGGFDIIWYNEHTISVVEKIVDLANGKDTFIYNDVPIADYQAMFTSGKVFIMPERIGTASKLRGMDDDFGIIPYPLFDENQTDYMTTTEDVASMICIPMDAPDPDTSALIIEALCRDSHENVTPVLYDRALKGKYARDEESAQMLDLIRQSLTFDCGWVNSQVTQLGAWVYYQMAVGNDKNFASWYASNESSLKANVEEFMKAYTD